MGHVIGHGRYARETYPQGSNGGGGGGGGGEVASLVWSPGASDTGPIRFSNATDLETAVSKLDGADCFIVVDASAAGNVAILPARVARYKFPRCLFQGVQAATEFIVADGATFDPLGLPVGFQDFELVLYLGTTTPMWSSPAGGALARVCSFTFCLVAAVNNSAPMFECLNGTDALICPCSQTDLAENIVRSMGSGNFNVDLFNSSGFEQFDSGSTGTVTVRFDKSTLFLPNDAPESVQLRLDPAAQEGEYGNNTETNDIVLDGVTGGQPEGITGPVGSVYTATQDIHCTSLRVASGVTLKMAGFRLSAKRSIINYGTISNDGASGATGGAGAPAGTVGAGGNGGAGGNPGVGGGGSPFGRPAYAVGAGSTGGAGGNGAVGAGGASGAYVNVAPTFGDVSTAPQSVVGLFMGAGGVQAVTGGGGGGGGGDGAAGGGGAGGGGAGPLIVSACAVMCMQPGGLPGGLLQATGGDGQAASAADAGGGGGGGGGLVLVNAQAAEIHASVTGGAGGASSLNAGQPGADGEILLMPNGGNS